MESVPDFSRTLALLRKERGVSQRVAAEDLGVSQALLSHYEKGIREPGLPFVVRACDYYHVSADFILGRTLSRDGTMLSSEDVLKMNEPDNILRGSVLATLHAKLLSGAEGILLGLLGKLNDREAINAAAAYLGTAIYQLYRRLYRASGANEAYFSTPAEEYSLGLAEADMKMAEQRYAAALRGLQKDHADFPELSDEALTAAYPGRSQCVAQVLHSADTRLSNLAAPRE